MSVFTGAGTALVTPMTKKGDVDFTKMRDLIEFQIENGADAIIVCGSTGEASTLSIEEHISCVRYCCEFVNKRIPVIAGTGSNSTETAMYLSKEAEKVGADALLVVTPYYNKCTENGLKKHFRMIAAAVKVPILIYHIPVRTGVWIRTDTLIELCTTVSNIVGVKDATGDFSYLMELMAKADGKVDVYSGNDDQILPLMALGGKGVISVISNILPRETHDIVAKYMEGDTEGSRALQLKYWELIHNLFTEVNPIPIKKAMNLLGMEAGPLRMPLTEMGTENAERLIEAMKAVGLQMK